MNARTESGYTALHCASWNNSRGTVRVLLEHGADPKIKTTDGKTVADFPMENMRHTKKCKASKRCGECLLRYTTLLFPRLGKGKLGKLGNHRCRWFAFGPRAAAAGGYCSMWDPNTEAELTEITEEGSCPMERMMSEADYDDFY